MTIRQTMAALSISCAWLLPSLAFAEGGPGALEAFKQSNQEMIALAEADAPVQDLQTKTDALLDHDWIAQAALGRPDRLETRCHARCDEYQALITRLIRKNYLKRIVAKDTGSIEYVREHVRSQATKVDTKVDFTDPQGERKTVEIDYVMHQVDGRWLVRDIITEGVSLAKNYQYEIARLYEDGGIDKIIATLQKKLEELDAK
jgi:phospholipid transport system substrate-binding protein